jgi:antitoxin component of MazEF toxin-antitoxin module
MMVRNWFSGASVFACCAPASGECGVSAAASAFVANMEGLPVSGTSGRRLSTSGAGVRDLIIVIRCEVRGAWKDMIASAGIVHASPRIAHAATATGDGGLQFDVLARQKSMHPMRLAIRRIGNSLGVIVPRSALAAWGVGEGDTLELTEHGVRPPRGLRSAHQELDELKRLLALAVVRDEARTDSSGPSNGILGNSEEDE